MANTFINYTNKFGNDGLELVHFDWDDEDATIELFKLMEGAIESGEPLTPDQYGQEVPNDSLL